MVHGAGVLGVDGPVGVGRQPWVDQVVEGGSVFIESEAASFLDDKLLDADASGEEVEFSLRDQAEAE